MDIIIIGAGPVGLYTGKLLSSNGLRVMILEEHREIGKPLHCSGLVSRRIERFVKPGNFVEHEVIGAKIYFGEKELKLKKPETAAYVINREKFDRYLAELAKKSGCEILTNSRVEKIVISDTHVKVKTKDKEFQGKIVLGCDGSNSVLWKEKPKERIPGLIVITSERNFSKYVEIFINKNIAPDGFLWKIPRGKTTEYGMWSTGSEIKRLVKFFSLEKKAVIGSYGGLIPLGLKKTYFNRTLLIGDSASQVKPWSGGGLIYGLLCSRIAYKVIKKAFQRNDFSEKVLKEYESRWKGILGKRIQTGMFFRRVFKRTDERWIETGFDALRVFTPLLNRLDMDFLF